MSENKKITILEEATNTASAVISAIESSAAAVTSTETDESEEGTHLHLLMIFSSEYPV